MNVRDRRLGGGQQIKFAERGGILAFAHGVGLVNELGELADAGHAIAADDVRRRNLRVTVLGRVQFQEKLDERALQLRAPVGVEQEAAAGNFRAAREVHQFEAFAKLDV